MKTKIDKYTFDASAKTVEFVGYGNIDLDRILLITNVTDNIIIYSFADTAKGGSVSANILTLDYDTTSMSDYDKLLIFYQEEDKQVGTSVGDERVIQLLEDINVTLKKIEYHQMLVTDADLKETNF